MDAAPSFGVRMISEVPSNPQLTLINQNRKNWVKLKTLKQIVFGIIARCNPIAKLDPRGVRYKIYICSLAMVYSYLKFIYKTYIACRLKKPIECMRHKRTATAVSSKYQNILNI